MDDTNHSQFNDSESQADNISGNLGINNPLLPVESLAKSQRIPQFIVPLGVQSLSILDTSIFRFQEPEPNSHDTIRDSPFFADYGQVKGLPEFDTTNISVNAETSIQRQLKTNNLITEIQSNISPTSITNHPNIDLQAETISLQLVTNEIQSSSQFNIDDEDITANTFKLNNVNQLNNIPQVPQVLQKLGVINSLTPSTPPTSSTPPAPSTNKWSSFTDLVQGQTTPLRRKSNNAVNNGIANTMVQAKFERKSPSIQSQAADSELVTVGNSQSATDVSEGLEALAKAIYEKLRQRLRIDQERHGRGYNGRLPW